MMAYVKFDGTFKELWSARNGTNSCFVSAGYKNYQWQDGNNLLKLDDAFLKRNSGYITFTVGVGWKVALRLATENTNWFQQEVDPALSEDAGDFKDRKKPTFPADESDAVIWEDEGLFRENQSNMYITLNEGDILLIDVEGGTVDKDSSFRIFKDGVEYIKDYGQADTTTEDQTYVRLMGAYYFDADAVPSEEGDTVDTGDGEVVIVPEGGVADPDDVVITPEDVESDEEIDIVEEETPPAPPEDNTPIVRAIVMSIVLLGVGIAAFSILRRSGGEMSGE